MRGRRRAQLRALLVASALAGAGLGSVTALAGPSGAAADPELHFESVACATISSVPANRLGEGSDALDDTGGAYRRWSGEPAGHPVTGYLSDGQSAPLPEGCRVVPGVRFRLSASQDGAQLRPRSSTYVPPGEEDGRLTSRTEPTGPQGVLVLRRSMLTGAQQAALGPGGGGLWVSAEVPASWRFANLSCHYDHTNPDNLEAVRLSGPGPATCVVHLLGPVEHGPLPAPLPAPAPPPAPAPSPGEGQAPVVPAPPTPAPPPPPPPSRAETPAPGHDAAAPEPEGPAPGTPLPSPPPGGAPSTTAFGRTPGGDLVTGTTTPPPPAPEAHDGPPPAGGEDAPGASAPATTGSASSPPAPPRPATPDGEEHAGAVAPTTVRLVVRVGGVLRREAGAEALVAALRCGGTLVTVPLDPERAGPDEVAERLVLDEAGRCTAGVDVASPGGPSGSGASQPVEVRINGERVETGDELAFWPPPGDEGEVLVEVTYGPRGAGPLAAAPPGRQVAEPGPLPTAGLALLFALGLAGSIWASRRRTFIHPQKT